MKLEPFVILFTQIRLQYILMSYLFKALVAELEICIYIIYILEISTPLARKIRGKSNHGQWPPAKTII